MKQINVLIEWLLFNANSAIFQLYHGENMLIFNEMMMMIRSGLEPTSYHTQSEYANHYITDAVVDSGNMCQIQIDV
jgi:hypothetical protein